MAEKLSSKELMNLALADHYEEIRQAKARGEKIGFSTSNFCKEITATFGAKVMFPENHSAAIASKKGAVNFCEKAESLGYSMDLCSYARINLGYLASDRDFGFGLDVPTPDFLVVSNNICNTVIKWYENMAAEYDIPFFFFETPYNMDGVVKKNKSDYMMKELDVLIHQMEEFFQKPFDYELFREKLEISNKNGILFQKALDLVGHTPSPASGFDTFNYMSLMVTLKDSPKTTEILERYIEELQERIDTGVTTFKGEEKYRVMLDGMCCWPYLRYCSNTLANMGINMVGSIYCDIFAQQFRTLREYVEEYSKTNNNCGLDLWHQRRGRVIQDYKVDGVMAAIARSCKPWVGILYEDCREMDEKFNVPYTIYNGDQADPRAFSEAQYETRLQGLAEVMEARKNGGKQND